MKEILVARFGLLTTRMSFLRSNLVRGSDSPQMQGRHAKPRDVSDGSAHLKNMDTNSSGGGVVRADFFFKMLEITFYLTYNPVEY